MNLSRVFAEVFESQEFRSSDNLGVFTVICGHILCIFFYVR